MGLHAIYAYCLTDKCSRQNRHRCVFALPRSRTLSQVIAGASGAAPAYLDAVPQGQDLVVVLQDDRQHIRPTEEGTAERFRQFAEGHGISHTACSLASQKREGYLGSYVSDLDKLLYDRWEQHLQRQSTLELRCWDEAARDWHIDLEKSRDDSFRIPLQKSPPQVAAELMLNTCRVLLTRAKGSVHIWFRDQVMRDHIRMVLGF